MSDAGTNTSDQLGEAVEALDAAIAAGETGPALIGRFNTLRDAAATFFASEDARLSAEGFPALAGHRMIREDLMTRLDAGADAARSGAGAEMRAVLALLRSTCACLGALGRGAEARDAA